MELRIKLLIMNYLTETRMRAKKRKQGRRKECSRLWSGATILRRAFLNPADRIKVPQKLAGHLTGLSFAWNFKKKEDRVENK